MVRQGKAKVQMLLRYVRNMINTVVNKYTSFLQNEDGKSFLNFD